jgi:DNA polymerase (family 10)
VSQPGLTNAQIADQLVLYAALLELSDARPFTARAFRRAADVIRGTAANVPELVDAGRVQELRGIGPGIEARLHELLETGEIAELRRLGNELTPELGGLARLLGINAKRMSAIARALGISTIAGFREAAAAERLTEVPGIGPVTAARIRASLEREPASRRGLTLERSRRLAQAIADALAGVVAGEARRGCELASRLDVVCAAENPRAVLASFRDLATVVSILEETERTALGVSVEGVPVSLVVAAPGGFGTALVRATGSPAYVASLEPLPERPTEESVFEALGLPWRPPELREVPIQSLPARLLEAADVRGDLHCHSSWSDGRDDIHAMALAARARGYQYLAVCDHTPGVRVVPGLDGDALRRQAEEIAEVNERVHPFRVLRGAECDIRADGELDLDDAILAELEWVQLSLHAGQRRPGAELTKIVCYALRHPAVSALSHPTGRILGHRPENAIDLDAVYEVAVETGVALEINGLPDRIDLSSVHVQDAIAAGARLVLNSDAHSALGLANMDLAVLTARRGRAAAANVVNTRQAAELPLRGGAAGGALEDVRGA